MAPYSTALPFPAAILAFNTIGLALSFGAVVVRLWARHIRRAKWSLSDYTIIASWLFALGLITSENFAITHGGVGQPIELVTPEELIISAQQFVAIGVFGSLAVSLVKISILDFLLSIFSTHDRFRVPAYILMAITTGYAISFTVVSLAGCSPFAANWDKTSYPNYKCINTSRFYTSQTVIGAVLDFSILLLPIPFVWNLRLPTKKKLGLSLLFSVGILICGISLARVVYNTKQSFQLTHFTEYAGIAVLLGSLEVNLFIINACLPTFPTLTRPLSEWIKSTLSSKNRSWKRLITGFSTKPSGIVQGSERTNSSFVKLSDPDSNSAEPVSNEADLESAKIQRQHDKLYPLSVTMASQLSAEGDQDWAYQQAETRTQITSADKRQQPYAIEMSAMGPRAEPPSSINVTRSWKVGQS